MSNIKRGYLVVSLKALGVSHSVSCWFILDYFKATVGLQLRLIRTYSKCVVSGRFEQSPSVY